MHILIIANTFYQIIFAIQLKTTVFNNERVTLCISDHSNNAETIARRIRDSAYFDEVHFVKTKHLLYVPKLSDSVRQFFEICFGTSNKYCTVCFDNVDNSFDELISYNIGRDTVSIYSVLSQYNKNIKLSRYEEGILSYNNTIQKIVTPKRKIMDFVRKIQGKPQFTKSGKNFYCFYPELYKGELNPVKIPLISDTPKTMEIIKKVFDVNLTEDDYKEKYIFFTSVYDFEGEHPIGEYDLVCKIADRVGKENLLIKTHPRDKRTIYTDNGFKVDKNSNIPWEAIQLSGDFSDKVFLTATSGSVLSGSFMSSKPPKTFYLYKLCHIDGNKTAEESRRNITELLADKNVKSIFGRVKIAESIEDILE